MFLLYHDRTCCRDVAHHIFDVTKRRCRRQRLVDGSDCTYLYLRKARLMGAKGTVYVLGLGVCCISGRVTSKMSIELCALRKRE